MAIGGVDHIDDTSYTDLGKQVAGMVWTVTNTPCAPLGGCFPCLPVTSHRVRSLCGSNKANKAESRLIALERPQQLGGAVCR
jgi:hypothetical protein